MNSTISCIIKQAKEVMNTYMAIIYSCYLFMDVQCVHILMKVYVKSVYMYLYMYKYMIVYNPRSCITYQPAETPSSRRQESAQRRPYLIIHVHTFWPLVSSSSNEPMSKASAALTSPRGGMSGGGYFWWYTWFQSTPAKNGCSFTSLALQQRS